MADIDKLKVEIDRDGCIGDGACCSDAPETFEMDDEDKAILKDGSTDSRDAIIEAAENCPTDAIIITDKETGEKIYPED
jgi:ferredoxin